MSLVLLVDRHLHLCLHILSSSEVNVSHVQFTKIVSEESKRAQVCFILTSPAEKLIAVTASTQPGNATGMCGSV